MYKIIIALIIIIFAGIIVSKVYLNTKFIVYDPIKTILLYQIMQCIYYKKEGKNVQNDGRKNNFVNK